MFGGISIVVIRINVLLQKNARVIDMRLSFFRLLLLWLYSRSLVFLACKIIVYHILKSLYTHSGVPHMQSCRNIESIHMHARTHTYALVSLPPRTQRRTTKANEQNDRNVKK